MKNQKQKTKSKVAEFFGTIGKALAFVWMLPVLAVEGIKERFEKKRKDKQPKPEPIKFVCSECGETFEADNVKKEVRNHASSNGDYSYSKPQPCPKCGGKRTRPTESDKAFYQRLWDMEETATFISPSASTGALTIAPSTKVCRSSNAPSVEPRSPPSTSGLTLIRPFCRRGVPIAKASGHCLHRKRNAPVAMKAFGC